MQYANEDVRRDAVRAAILADPDASNRELARRVDVSHPFVQKVRRELIAEDLTEPRWVPSLNAFEAMEERAETAERKAAQLAEDGEELVRRLRETSAEVRLLKLRLGKRS